MRHCGRRCATRRRQNRTRTMEVIWKVNGCDAARGMADLQENKNARLECLGAGWRTTHHLCWVVAGVAQGC